MLSSAMLLNRSYALGICWMGVATALIYWPGYFRKRWNYRIEWMSRGLFILTIFILMQTVFKSLPKESIYTSPEEKGHLMDIYAKQMISWPENTEHLYIMTKFGKVHVLALGDTALPPVILLHAASMGAHSWAENLPALIDQYRIYAIDNIGEGNLSELSDALMFPRNDEEIADLYVSLMDSLGVKQAPVLGASNGGFIAMSLAKYYPYKVTSLVLFGPMGLTPLTFRSIMMLSIASMYPLQPVRDWVMEWALGTDRRVIENYGEWFNTIMKGTIPSVAQPLTLSKSDKEKMTMPVLLFLGTNDALVGDASMAADKGREFPNISIEIMNSGHLIAVEKADSVNQILERFLASR